jgi:hypothetical protein
MKLLNRLLLSVVYFALVSPAALVLKFAGRDAMHRRFDRASETYRTASRATTRESLEKPY